MQGRYKRDGSAAADPELRGGTDRASSQQRAQSNGPASGTLPTDRTDPAPVGDSAAERPKTKGPVGPGSRLSLRNWRISTRLVSLIALPVVAATTLGGLRISSELDNMDQLDRMQLLTEMTRQATELADALQEERDRSAGPLAGSGNTKDDTDVVAPREETDRAIKSFKEHTDDVDAARGSMAGVRATIVDIQRQLGTLNEVRNKAYSDDENVAQTITSYNQLITSLLALSQDMAQATSNPEMIQSTRSLAAFSSAKEYASMQRAFVSAGLSNKGHAHLSANDRLAGRTAEDNEESALKRFSNIYPGAASLMEGLDSGNDDIEHANSFADRSFKTESGIRGEQMSYLDWYDLDTNKINLMSRIETTLLSQMEQKSRELRNDATTGAILNGAVILLVLGISLIGAFVVSRSMVRSLRRLQDTAQTVSQKRLPELVKHLSEADPQDVDTSVESVGVHSRDEIGKVATAFDEVHREAVRLASEQALLRGNVNAMFTNLSRRSQGLIQRQLSLISELESREADPDQLSSLFKLDHLATRMRRNGENLLVLAGEEPGRRWTRPVPLVDVLRAAASEVEQYERIELSAVPTTEVAGRVVNDLVHLLAELLENATSFSSPQTKVKVTGHALPDGRVLVEIHDTGIGLSPEDLSAINERLASPPTVDVSVSRRMGLFVVGRLSLRHGIRVQLRPSDSGGTTALVMLPVDVAQSGGAGKKPGPGGKAAGGRGTGDAGGGHGQHTSRLAGLQPRGQVGAGPRTALPTRPGAGQPGGAPGAPGAPAPAQNNAFGNRPAAPAGQDRPTLPVRGGEPAQPPAASHQPTVAPPTGAPAPRGERPQLPTRSPAGELTGPSAAESAPREPSQQPGANWGARREAADDWPLAPRHGQEEHPRGHEEPEHPGRHRGDGISGRPGTTGQFERPAAGGPGDTAQFERPDFGGQRPGANAPARGASPAQGAPQGDRPLWSGEFELPAAPSSGQPAEEAPAPPPASAAPASPMWSGEFAPQSAQDGRPAEESAPAPARGEEAPRGGQAYDNDSFGRDDSFGREDAFGGDGAFGRAPRAGEVPVQQQPHSAPDDADLLGGPAPRSTGDAGSPIFDTIESNWFTQPGGSAAEEPASRPQSAPESPRLPRREPTGRGAQAQAEWRSTPNDDVWRRAEQVRQPAAGGITTSGLPRRVPRANLVAGTAQQEPRPGGPQVSRSPDDVRGRLTNLRRGIQQGRQAGHTGTHPVVDPTHQQER
ncbi:nitrate- and nitrite sensing domain-containing protein [Streptomyces sp. NPDC053542]|uniref:sensor histidine kinase n=1 Tax=Streptomyces sp. NPDC053542 TaxID=3365710 RepID=UPI0037D57F7F